MKATTAYRRISSWTDEQCHPFKDTPMPEGFRYRPLIMAAAARLSGKLAAAQTNEELLNCVIAYERMIRAGETSEADLKFEARILLDEFNRELPEHQLN